MKRGPDGKLLARTVSHVPTNHATVPDGMTIDAGKCMKTDTGGSPPPMAPSNRSSTLMLPLDPSICTVCCLHALHPMH